MVTAKHVIYIPHVYAYTSRSLKVAIDASAPSVINAEFNHWAFQFSTSGFPAVPFGSPEGTPVPDVSATVELQKFRNRPSDDLPELSPIPSDRKSMRIQDIFELAQEDEDVGAALTALMAAVAKVGHAKGLL